VKKSKSMSPNSASASFAFTQWWRGRTAHQRLQVHWVCVVDVDISQGLCKQARPKGLTVYTSFMITEMGGGLAPQHSVGIK
jgi:hypothetical protein